MLSSFHSRDTIAHGGCQKMRAETSRFSFSAHAFTLYGLFSFNEMKVKFLNRTIFLGAVFERQTLKKTVQPLKTNDNNDYHDVTFKHM